MFIHLSNPDTSGHGDPDTEGSDQDTEGAVGSAFSTGVESCGR
jgi:hypothetical protein